MRLRLSVKLFLAILAACAVVLAINGVFARHFFTRDFLGYLNEQGVERMRGVAPLVGAAYAEHGDWEFLRTNTSAWFHMMRPPDGSEPPVRGVPPVSDQTGAVLRLALFDLQGNLIAGNANASIENDSTRLPVLSGGAQVGWLAMVPFQKAINAGDVRFYNAQVRARWVNGAASVLVAALIALLLTGTLLKRLKVLTQFVHRLAQGDYSQRIASMNRDEIDRLASDISQLADKLENIEQNRRAFMADISHELRTPLAVLKAELEAIQDGIRPMNLSTLAPLQSEVQQLHKLVDDFYDLAVTQTGQFSYEFENIDLRRIVRSTAANLQARAADRSLALQLDAEEAPVFIHGDESRLQQLISNLLENAIRYTDAGGRIRVQIHESGGEAHVCIEDSSPGVEPEQRERLFDRFYRVEASRNRASGGSGLGLAICRNIVESHGGRIHAEASTLGGLRIVICIPLQARHAVV
ncbi:ATP-binding protein [Diaphorobacter caeni]|uniref:ATP-binding protein n=1 Tax=Diaphorobacter caeni TaxID=2784387 RepID=UPI00188E06BB|nr:ATP-binding protein [Diaphorobacter caeni]MBF5005909.1 HAMP domain-containing protein [Diaphorobacter caeni]